LKSASLQYANALADVALEQGQGEPAIAQLYEFAAAYQESGELRNVLNSPAVSLDAKHGVVEKMVERLGASRIIRNFLFVVVDHQRSTQIPEISETVQHVILSRQGVAEAEVVSAVEMNEGQKNELLQNLEKQTGKKLQAKYSVDASLLGGALVRIGDTIYDGSVRNRLQQMRERLAAE
jgi:F-type H+-transporting ATPase subunit delta